MSDRLQTIASKLMSHWFGNVQVRRYYTCFVRKGCTMWDLQYQFRVSRPELMRANPQLVQLDRAYGGQLLLLPIPGAPRIRRRDRASDFHVCRLTGRPESFRTALSEPYIDDGWMPARPEFGVIRNAEELLGRGEAPAADREAWERANLVMAEVPALRRLGGSGVRMHRRAAAQVQALFAAWDAHGLLPRVQSWEGAYAAAGSGLRGAGLAFALNERWNAKGQSPARLGREGCVRELVDLANQHGFYWHGHLPGEQQHGAEFSVARWIA
jgi:hypothetical protein